ncbi:MAG: hypothetical protein JNG84_00500 [Archangium sp.]|nr:hypothetical protein [Archangium sp.]
MGFLKGIGKAFKAIGKGIGTVVKGVVKFAKSPIGKILIGVGLSLVTGGVGGIIAKGAAMVMKLGKVGKLVSTFAGFANKFLGPVQSFVSKSGVGFLGNFVKQAGSTNNLLKMATSLFSARAAQPATDPTTNQVVSHNLLQIFAQRQAELFRLASAQ